MMLAVLVDRPALTMRSLGLAAAVLLMARPGQHRRAGIPDVFRGRAGADRGGGMGERRGDVSRAAGLWRYAHGIILTSLVGSFATLALRAVSFRPRRALRRAGQSAGHAGDGILGDAVRRRWRWLLMPLGWDAPPLRLMGWGIDVMVAMGRWVSGLPGAVSQVRGHAGKRAGADRAGRLWMVIWRTRLALVGLVPVLLGVVLAVMARAPDMLVAPDARDRGHPRRVTGGCILRASPRTSSSPRTGCGATAMARDIADAIGMPGLKCDGVGCAVTARACRSRCRCARKRWRRIASGPTGAGQRRAGGLQGAGGPDRSGQAREAGRAGAITLVTAARDSVRDQSRGAQAVGECANSITADQARPACPAP